MSRIWAIAANTQREAIRNRILYALLFFSLIPIASATLLGHLTLGEYGKIVMDVGLAAIAMFGVLIAVFVGIGLVNREIERKTIYTITTKPVSRVSFILGKYLGLLMVLTLLVGLMGVANLISVWLNGVSVDATYLIVLGMTLVELMVVTAFAVLYSTFTGPTLASFFSLSTVVIGHLTTDIRDTGARSELEFVQTLSALAYRILPNLETFNVRSEVVNGIELSAQFLTASVLYGVGYSAAVIALAALIFHSRDF